MGARVLVVEPARHHPDNDPVALGEVVAIFRGHGPPAARRDLDGPFVGGAVGVGGVFERLEADAAKVRPVLNAGTSYDEPSVAQRAA